MRPLDEFLNESKLASKIKPILNSVVKFMKRELNTTPKKLTLKKKKSKDQIGDVSLDKNSLENDTFTVYYNPDLGIRMQIKAIIHEMTHVKQIHKGELRPSDDFKSILWKDNYELSILDYKKSQKDFKTYSNLPWEKEAYKNMNLYMDKYLESKELNDLKGKDNFLDFVIDSI